MSSLRQSDRLMQFTSPLGKDVLLIESLDGAEGVSRLFEYHAELFATTDTEIDPTELIGAKVSVSIGLSDLEGVRWVHGIVASFEQSSGDSEFDLYRARIVPALWQLKLSVNCRVFQNKTVMDIVKEVIGEYGLTLADQTSEPFPALDYCTQYDESDFHFITRILEQHGVFYWFEHTEADDKVFFGDSRNAYVPCPVSSAFDFRPQNSGRDGSYGAVVSDFRSTATMVPGKHTARDYDFRSYTPHEAAPLESESDFGDNAYERFLFPAGEEGYVKKTDKALSSPNLGKLFLNAEALAADSVSQVFHGISNARSITAGYTFDLSRHPRDAWNQPYFITEVVHRASQSPSYRSGGAVGGGYSNRFSAVPADIVYKPQQSAQKPRIYGPQTAIVVVPEGEDMWLDKLGRVCVQFFWDRDRKPNTIDNTWIRVAQPWAGSGWGTFFWPRVKDEVVVHFLNGDPDNPVVVGSVYNGTSKPKYDLPTHSTRSGMVTRSSRDGKASNANELYFEDKKGAEEIFINAERDMNTTVEHSNTRKVGADESISVGGSRSLTVSHNQTTEIKKNLKTHVLGDSDLTIDGDHRQLNDGDTHHTHSGDLNEQIGGDYSIEVQGSHNEKVGKVYVVDSGQEVHFKAGQKVMIDAGGSGICLKGPGGFITINASGITIQGNMVKINSGGTAFSGTAVKITEPEKPSE